MKNVVVIGARGAIGSSFVAQLAARTDVESIHAFSRTEPVESSSKIFSGILDLGNEDSIKAAAEKAAEKTPLDMIIVATGLLHEGNLVPEKSLKDLTAEKFNHIFAVNTIGPALVLKHFLPRIHKDQRAVCAILSARVGSISDNELGGWYAYRASKAALNMVIKNASIEIARRCKEAVIIGLHPGTVNSKLSKPFQGYVTPNHLFTPEYAVEKMLQVLNDVQPSHSGQCFAYDGLLINP